MKDLTFISIWIMGTVAMVLLVAANMGEANRHVLDFSKWLVETGRF